jgi:hypothetical protein
LDSILNTLHLRTDNPGSKVITKFETVPPPIPPEYVATLFTELKSLYEDDGRLDKNDIERLNN